MLGMTWDHCRGPRSVVEIHEAMQWARECCRWVKNIIIKDPGVLTPFAMKWYHGVVTRNGYHGVMPLYGTMESVPMSGARGSTVASIGGLS